jgi:lipoate-protein ligase A
MLNITEYNLPDRSLLSPNGKLLAHLVWQPTETVVVIGNGSAPEVELHTPNIVADGVPVLRRDSGGCSVTLTPDMLCVSIAAYGKSDSNTIGFFRRFNSIIITAIGRLGIEGVRHAGMSDIAVGDRKIAGTAIYRNRDVVFYHAVVNVAADAYIFDRYLLMPPRMPEYRKGRSHQDFVTSLRDLGLHLSIHELKNSVEAELRRSIESHALSLPQFKTQPA